MLRLVLVLVLSLTSLAWADPADELKACQAQIESVTIQARQTRTAYISQLAELIAEMRAQLMELTAQRDQARQELLRARK